MCTRISRLAVCPIVLFAVFCLATGFAEDAQSRKTVPRNVKTADMNVEVKIDADYPVFDIPYMDNIIKGWLTAHTSMIMDNAKDLPDADIPEAILHVKIDYEATDGLAGIVNVVFTTSYTSNLAAHPSRSLNTFVLSPKGEPLFLDSLFSDPECALRIFSEQSPNLLTAYYENEDLDGIEDWIAKGTGPFLENYGCYTVEPDGIRVYFQEYQVTPYALGMPDVLIPLAALESAGPNAEVWKPGAKGASAAGDAPPPSVSLPTDGETVDL